MLFYTWLLFLTRSVLFQYRQGAQNHITSAGDSWYGRWGDRLFSWADHLRTMPTNCWPSVGGGSWSQWCWTVWTVSWPFETVHQCWARPQLTRGAGSRNFHGSPRWRRHWQWWRPKQLSTAAAECHCLQPDPLPHNHQSHNHHPNSNRYRIRATFFSWGTIRSSFSDKTPTRWHCLWWWQGEIGEEKSERGGRRWWPQFHSTAESSEDQCSRWAGSKHAWRGACSMTLGCLFRPVLESQGCAFSIYWPLCQRSHFQMPTTVLSPFTHFVTRVNVKFGFISKFLIFNFTLILSLFLVMNQIFSSFRSTPLWFYFWYWECYRNNLKSNVQF